MPLLVLRRSRQIRISSFFLLLFIMKRWPFQWKEWHELCKSSLKTKQRTCRKISSFLKLNFFCLEYLPLKQREFIYLGLWSRLSTEGYEHSKTRWTKAFSKKSSLISETKTRGLSHIRSKINNPIIKGLSGHLEKEEEIQELMRTHQVVIFLFDNVATPAK